MKNKSDTIGLRLKRIEGQVQGLAKMYEEGSDCLELVQQIAAAKSALTGVARDVLTGEASKCNRTNTSERFDKVLAKLLEL